ncbi:MAG: DJ-1/PfpI family protein, partial [Acidobacteria bacterium]|nr:DJ-1/PfpI family protein [Acidobacteriota bacterium]
DHTPADAPPPDIIVVPGGSTQHLLEDVAFMEWFRSAAEKAELVLTVCTGAFVPAKLGLLDGKTATTWYGAVENLREAAPKVTVQPGRRFVDNGRIVTTAGVSAGIDGALHVVARLLGRNVAERTAQYMEYHWSPEAYLARTYTLLNPSVDERGRRFQQASIAEDEGNVEQALAAFRELAQSDPADAYAWYRVGASLQRLGRLDEAIAAAERATTAPEVRAPALYNLACARALKGDKEGALRSIREAVDAGFDDFHALRTDPDLASIRSDSRFPRL